MYIEETDQAVIVKDTTVFDDRLGGQGTILKTNDNRFDPGAKFFNVIILTNHHTNREREQVYTSLYNGPNGPKGAIGPHIPSTMIKEIRIKEVQKVENIFLSSLFKRNKNYLGLNKFKLLSKLTKKKIIALGGISQQNIKSLRLLNNPDFAGISFFE